ncbi:MAG TPA: type II and III secretion system protein family protein [Stellaceae bacterium]|jgi:pilus assembly protein CpaC|nr:type II and III secretion system protein family protein [Stellaceae bacterium]
MHRFLVLAAAGAGFLSITCGDAAEPPAPIPLKAGPDLANVAGSPNEITATGAPLVLEAGKGTLLRLERPAATVFIANPDVADVQVKSPSLIYVNAKAPGETVLYAVDAGDQVLLNSPIRVEADVSRLRQSFQSLMPGEKINVRSVENSLVLSGTVSSAGKAEQARALTAAIARQNKDSRIINEMSVATPNQVNLRVKVAEVDRQTLKSLGINLTASGGRFQFLPNNPTTGGQIPTFAQNLITARFGPNSQPINVVLDALAQENLVNVLAEPNLTAVSGQTASFLAGGEFPVPVAGSAGSASGGTPTITIEFKKFGVSLDFTPTIIDANHVSLRVRPEVSELSTTGQVSVPLSGTTTVNIPALTVRRAETTVELGSGESFAMAGLLENSGQTNISKVPWLGDIPVLGQLFRSQQFQRNETELVIIVTPYLVNPSSTRMAAPSDGLVPRHDVEQIINAGVYQEGLPRPGKGPVGPGGQGLIGPVGFRLD